VRLHSGTVLAWLRLVTPSKQWTLVALVSAASGIAAWIAYAAPGSAMWDAGQFHLAVRAFLAGQDPYAVVAQHRPFPLFYPFSALLLFAPFALLPELPARIGWAMLQGGVLAWAAARYRPVLLIGLLSASYLDALVLGHFSPLFTAAALVPTLGFVWAAKPTLGAAFFAAFPSRQAAAGMLGITVVSLALMPRWPALWLDAVRHQIHTPPVLRPGGALLLLALLRWQRPEGRLLAAYAFVPQTTGLYDTLPLFLVPRRRCEAYLLAVLTFVAAFLVPVLYPWHQIEGEPLVHHLQKRWLSTLVLLYLPVLVMLLRPAPEPGPSQGSDAAPGSGSKLG
jgi:hypothetical protein